MKFDKYAYGSNEFVVFIDESGDPTMKDPGNPIFSLGACAIPGRDLNAQIRNPWLDVREAIVGSRDRAIHMRQTGRRVRGNKLNPILEFFDKQAFKRASFAISDRTVIDKGEFPIAPVLELALEHTLLAIAQLMTDDVPMEAVSVIFEEGPLYERIKPHFPNRELKRSDDVIVPVAWAALPKDELEPGLEVADFIAHTCSGFIRSNRDEHSEFARRYRSVHPKNRPELSKGLELNKAEFVERKI